jgi:hypothetical protein
MLPKTAWGQSRPKRAKPGHSACPLDGGTLRTIRETCDYMTSMDKKREVRTHWQRACKLILAKEDVLAVSRALELAAPPRSVQGLMF